MYIEMGGTLYNACIMSENSSSVANNEIVLHDVAAIESSGEI